MEEDFASLADQAEQDVVAFSKSTTWVNMKIQNGVEISCRQSPHFNGFMYKYSCIIDAPYHAVYDVLKPPKTREERLSWDKSIADYKQLLVFNDNLFIGVIVTPAVLMGVISSREFVDLFSFKTIDTGFEKKCWVFAKSVKCDKRPESKDFVRAITHPSGYSATPVNGDPDKSLVEFYINIDTGGMLPRSLVESAMPSQQIKYIESLNKEVKRRMRVSTKQ